MPSPRHHSIHLRRPSITANDVIVGLPDVVGREETRKFI